MSELSRLKAVAGNAPYTLLYCRDCEDTLASGYEVDRDYSWAIHFNCAKCGFAWRVCTLCSTSRTFMWKKGQFTRHNHKHSREEDEPITSTLQSEFPKSSSPIESKYFHRPASVAYFTACQNHNGINYLTSMAVFHNSSIVNDLEPDDVKTFMSTAHFISTISRSQREDLADVLHNVFETTKRHVTSEECVSSTPPSPAKSIDSPPRKKLKVESELKVTKHKIEPLITKQKIRSSILEGKFSLLQNLAHPLVRTNPTHSFILPSEALADFLAHGLAEVGQEDKLHPVESLGESYHGKQIVSQNNCKTIFASLWSDGFDPNNTLKNRGSCWIMTICFQSPESQKITINNIYPIIIGKEGNDHNNVVSIVIKDLLSLQKKKTHPW